MLRGDLYHMLMEMSPKFRFHYKAIENHRSSLWYINECHCEDPRFMVCALPDHHIPEYTIIERDHIKERGWRAILRIVKDTKHHNVPIVNEDVFSKVLAKRGISSLNDYAVKVNCTF